MIKRKTEYKRKKLLAFVEKDLYTQNIHIMNGEDIILKIDNLI